MKRHPEPSNFTNAVKPVAYPVCMPLVAAAIALPCIWFNR